MKLSVVHVFYGFSQSLQANARLVPWLGHAHVLQDPLRLIDLPTIWYYIIQDTDSFVKQTTKKIHCTDQIWTHSATSGNTGRMDLSVMLAGPYMGSECPWDPLVSLCWSWGWVNSVTWSSGCTVSSWTRCHAQHSHSPSAWMSIQTQTVR